MFLDLFGVLMHILLLSAARKGQNFVFLEIFGVFMHILYNLGAINLGTFYFGHVLIKRINTWMEKPDFDYNGASAIK